MAKPRALIFRFDDNMIRSSVFITMISLTGTFLGFLGQIFIAQRYGLGVAVDAYLFAVSVPIFVASIITGIMSHEFVPKIVVLDPDPTYRARFITTLLFGCFGITVIVGVGGVSFGVLQLQILPAESPTRTYEGVTLLLSLAWIFAAFQILQGAIVAILNAYQKYLFGASLLLFPYVGLLLSLNVESALGVSTLLLGLLSGVMVAILVGLFIIRSVTPLRIDRWLWPDIRHLFTGSAYAAIAMIVFSSFTVVDAYWASFATQGTLATLGLSQRIIIGFGNLAVAGPIVLLAPRLAQLLKDNDHYGFRLTLRHMLLIAAAISIALALTLAIFAKDLVNLLFARGSFSSADVISVAQTLRFIAPGMVFMLLSSIALRALFCLDGGAKSASRLGLAWAAAYFGASGLTYHYGAPGIALGYSAVWLVYFLIIVSIISRQTSLPKQNR